ncbi:carbohydrate ABC transporter permease [Lederbergia citri]|uniref:Sugar ABC transporter permease n=1 Tax=Lederbergia citri TaxID=2833580 RepID=A0A942THM5_9BACI|nr:sugar ABC transporter permease [Lederbergia citri]MBS4196767.1 sugar ABC transporter permease [Lederbergia citri]
MKQKKDKAWFALFTVPTLIAFVTVVIIPFFIGIYYSFFSWDGIPANPKIFVGFENYANLFGEKRFMTSAWLTTKFTVMTLIAVNVIGLGLALLVTTKLKVRNIARSMFFMPNLIGGLILGYIWKFIFSDAFLVIGEVTGFKSIFFNWMIDPQYSLYAMVIVFTWQMAGYVMIIYIAGIGSIPEDVLEAAKVDGANFWQKLTKITFPLLMPSFTICLFLSVSNSFKIFDVNLSLTGGGPNNATEMLAMNIYNEIFGYNNFGYGQSKAIIFFIIVAAITLTQVAITKKKEVEM